MFVSQASYKASYFFMALTIVAVLVIFAGGARTAYAQQICTFRVINQGPKQITQVHVRSDENAPWGANQLGARLGSNESQTFRLSTPPSHYDVQVIYEDQFEIVNKAVDVCANDLTVAH